MHYLLKTFKESKLLRFGIIGVLSSCINYSVFFTLLTIFDVNYLISSAIGFLSGVLGGFPFNRRWTFDDNKRLIKPLLINYLLLYVITLISSLLILKLLVETFYILPQYANIIIIGYAASANFLGLNFLVFRKREQP